MIENIVLSNLVYNDEYARKVLPYIKDEYFLDLDERYIFNTIQSFTAQYNSLPSKEAIVLTFHKDEKINEERFESLATIVDNLKPDPLSDAEWLVNETEKFCQDRALVNALRKSIAVIDGKSNDLDKGALPTLLSDALAVSFDAHLGHDYLDDWENQYDYYHRKEEKIEWDLEKFNQITKGGVGRKSLIVAMAPTNAGKSLFLTHLAAANLQAGLNVLYLTLEMSEEMTRERIDANLLDVHIDELRGLPKETYRNLVARVRGKTTGKLVIKEYPTASAHVGHFRHFINELKLKKKFKPDVIYVDYLNICASSRMKMGGSVNSFQLVMSIAQELRGLAVEMNVPIFTATQTNRNGIGNSDIDLTDTSESIGLTYVADMMFALIRTEELDQIGQVMIKQLKNRWGDKAETARFVIGLDRKKMRFYDVEDTAQNGIMPDRPVMDNSDFGSRWDEEDAPFDGGKKRRRDKAPSFEGFK
ncbi:DNA primase-helicase [Sinorhizobium phage phiM7]|uniref:DnaB-like replicative helicase n=2 Tax=Emdodecavirus TaxID=1980937 RepID=S5MCP0_9CAUD|nr:DNA primase-helicase [Sinorhizobium phage phiM12]YP_009601142.1 DNA primase-helicase [Sinorhizobium phage phiM7]AGR47659.1 DNA primase-helicase [Sinorhizobium phage phiM12]AKF12565.1 DNA primase-helicase [Sinorhizobium phage phiM7]AKF12925.1 DNA primase-helicase [Sinorhizobium phage phiM19]